MKWVVITLASRAPKEREHNRIAHFGRLLKLEIAVQLRNEGEEFQAFYGKGSLSALAADDRKGRFAE